MAEDFFSEQATLIRLVEKVDEMHGDLNDLNTQIKLLGEAVKASSALRELSEAAVVKDLAELRADHDALDARVTPLEQAYAGDNAVSGFRRYLTPITVTIVLQLIGWFVLFFLYHNAPHAG